MGTAVAPSHTSRLGNLVIGDFRVDFKHDSEAEVLEKARQLMRDCERRQEMDQVSRLTDAAEGGRQGVLGTDDSVQAVREGRADTLVVPDGVVEEGVACRECDHYAPGRSSDCPRCGGAVEAIPDVISRAVEIAIFTDGRVEVVFGDAREKLLRRGGLGATLRY